MRTRRELAALASLALGCAEAAPCDRYASESRVVEECASRHVPTTASIDAAEEACDAMGVARDACRALWASQHADANLNAPRERLLAMCGRDPDCSFRVLDSQPAGRLETEVEECRRYAARYGDDCIGHAMQRFAGRHPDATACAGALALADPAVKTRMLPGTCP